MSLINTDAIILKIINYSDTRKMVTLLTPYKGKITAIGFGSNKLSTNTNASYQIGNLVQVVLHKNEETDNVGTITTIDIKNQFRSTKMNLEKNILVQYILQYCDINLEELDKNTHMYNYLLSFLNFIDENNVNKNILSSWHLTAIRCLGFNPHIWSCRDCNRKIQKGYWSSEDGGMSCGCKSKKGRFIDTIELDTLKVISAEIPLKSDIEIPVIVEKLIFYFAQFHSVIPNDNLKFLETLFN